MPVVQKGVAALSGKLPKVISPKAHAILDYATVGAFGLLAGLSWKRHKRAAIAATICGAAELTTVLLTDFPGGVADVINLPTHVKMDFGLGAVASSMPTFMAFDDDPEAKWFRILGMNITSNAAFTDTGSMRRERRRRRAA